MGDLEKKEDKNNGDKPKSDPVATTLTTVKWIAKIAAEILK